MSSKQNKRCPRKAGNSCTKIMPYWDDSGVCRVCRNLSCSLSSVFNTCAVWTDDMWKKFDKCIMRMGSDMAKSSTALSKEVFAPIVIHCQVSKNGPDREIFVLPSVSKSVSATDTRNAVLSENEPDKDFVPQVHTQTLVGRSVSSIEHIFHSNCCLPRQYASPRSLRSPMNIRVFFSQEEKESLVLPRENHLLLTPR